MLGPAADDGRSDRVEILVDVLRDWLDLGVQFILNLEHFMLVIFSDEVEGETEMTKSSRASDPVEVGVRAAWEVEVHDHVHRHDVDTTGKQIGTHETSGLTVTEVVVNSRKVIHINVKGGIMAVKQTYLLRSCCCMREWIKKQE